LSQSEPYPPGHYDSSKASEDSSSNPTSKQQQNQRRHSTGSEITIASDSTFALLRKGRVDEVNPVTLKKYKSSDLKEKQEKDEMHRQRGMGWWL
jgi:hypothetical protein